MFNLFAALTTPYAVQGRVLPYWIIWCHMTSCMNSRFLCILMDSKHLWMNSSGLLNFRFQGNCLKKERTCSTNRLAGDGLGKWWWWLVCTTVKLCVHALHLLCACKCVCVHIRVCVCVCVCACMYVCMQWNRVQKNESFCNQLHNYDRSLLLALIIFCFVWCWSCLSNSYFHSNLLQVFLRVTSVSPVC